MDVHPRPSIMLRTQAVCLSVLALSAAVTARADGLGADDEGPKGPVALCWGAGGRLYVGLRDARRVVALDPGTWRVVAEWVVPVRPASLARGDDDAHLLVGSMDGQLL